MVLNGVRSLDLAFLPFSADGRDVQVVLRGCLLSVIPNQLKALRHFQAALLAPPIFSILRQTIDRGFPLARGTE